jgi:hypothetical protein
MRQPATLRSCAVALSVAASDLSGGKRREHQRRRKFDQLGSLSAAEAGDGFRVGDPAVGKRAVSLGRTDPG